MPSQNKKLLLDQVKDEFTRCEPVFLALGDEVRRKILLLLIDAECQGLNVNTITEMTHLSRPAISHHLKILKSAGIIHLRREGTKHFYYFDVESNLGDLCTMAERICTVMTALRQKKAAASA